MAESSEEKNIVDDTRKVAAEVQLQKYGAFFEEYHRNLDLLIESVRGRWNYSQRQYLQIDIDVDERLDTIHELINSENKIIDKVVVIFCKLCREVTFIEYTTKTEFMNVIGYYGEGLEEDAFYEDCQLLLSQILPILQRLSDFVIYCERLLNDILSQLSAFYRLHFDITDANLRTVFDSLADLLLTLLTLEETLMSNQTLLHHWTLYRRTIQLAMLKASEFSQEPIRIRQLNKLADRLEVQLLSGKMLENLFSANSERKVPIRENKRLEEEFCGYLKQIHSELETMLTKQNCTDMTRLMKLCLVFVLYVNIFGNYDRKLLKSIGEICKKTPLITLTSNVLVSLDSFFCKHASAFLKPAERMLFERDSRRCAKTCLAEAAHNLHKDVQYYTIQVMVWMLQLEARLESNTYPLTANVLEDVCKLLIDGVETNRQLKALLTTVSNLHLAVNQPMYKTSVISFCKLVELIKCVHAVYQRHHGLIFQIANYVMQFIQYQCLSIIRGCKRSSGHVETNFKEIRVDAMSSLVIAECCLCGPATADRLTAVNLCINLARQSKCLNDQDRQRLSQLLQKLSAIRTLLQVLDEVSACEFMYSNHSTLPLYLEEVERKEQDTNRIQRMFDALEDTIQKSSLISSVRNAFLSHVTLPICRKMEENLRLHVLSYLQPDTKLNFELNNFTQAEPLTIGGKRLDLKYQTETYLDQTFYDLTTVALHDWQIYGEMRVLAAYKFDLTTVDDGLPNHTLEQGPDLLEITRNIHAFVANHFYNLNNQIFIEACSNNKHVNVINIRHTANSIRAHGAGITSTAVNYTYQFLRVKLNLFSQLLYDEQIKSRLLKEVTAFREQPPNVKYPYDRVERFYRSVSKLGVKGDGASYVDQFRQLITQIGNALGYVRLIRSGSLRYFSDAISFMPNLKWLTNVESLCSEFHSSSNCKQAAFNLDNVITNVCHNIAEGSNYFKLLVDVFTAVVRNPNNDHLQCFFAIVPALTINFVEYFITVKEGLSKKTHQSRLTFTDDGFAMGIVYLLHTFEQYAKFEALQWFQSVEERNISARQKLKMQIAKTPQDDLKLNHTLNLSLRRLDIYQREFQHLRYNIDSAQILFQKHSDGKNENI